MKSEKSATAIVREWRILSVFFILSTLFFSPARAQSITSDSLILMQLKDYGIRFTNDNSVVLLMSG